MGKAWAKQLSSEYKRTKLSLVICVLLILTINPNLGQQWFLDSLTCIEPLLFVNSVAWSKRSRVVLTFHSGLFEPLNLFPKITLLEKKVEYAFLKCLVYMQLNFVQSVPVPLQKGRSDHINPGRKHLSWSMEMVIFVQNDILMQHTISLNFLKLWQRCT